MKRDYSDGVTDDAKLFIGTEIEKTPAYGMKTLFVVGLDHAGQDLIKICQSRGINHIYMGANHSFDGEDQEAWEQLILGLLKMDYWVTLDLDVKVYEHSLDTLTVACEYDRFIPQISVKLPYLTNLNYNATVKIDDKDFRSTNPGVWVHQLHELQHRDRFTDWSQYGKDEIYKPIVRTYDTSKETDLGDFPAGSDTSLSSSSL